MVSFILGSSLDPVSVEGWKHVILAPIPKFSPKSGAKRECRAVLQLSGNAILGGR